MTTINAAPTTNPSALINNAIDLGLSIDECSIGDGFIIVSGLAAEVIEWVNGTPTASIQFHGRYATAARTVLARPEGWVM